MSSRSTISASTQADLRSGEGQDCDFKEHAEDIGTEDFVSFANARGGRVYLGVKERKGRTTTGAIVGTSVDDKTKLQVTNKAASCLPSVEHRIHSETDSAGRSILVVEIPESRVKPHCMPDGRYKIRLGSRNAPLVPEALRSIISGLQPHREESFHGLAVRRGADGPIMPEVLIDYPLQQHMATIREDVLATITHRNGDAFGAMAILIALIWQSQLGSIDWRGGPVFEPLTIEHKFMERIRLGPEIHSLFSLQPRQPFPWPRELWVPKGFFLSKEFGKVRTTRFGGCTGAVIESGDSRIWFTARLEGGQILGPQSFLEFMRPSPDLGTAPFTDNWLFACGWDLDPALLHSAEGSTVVQFFNETVANLRNCYSSEALLHRRPHPAVASIQLMLREHLNARPTFGPECGTVRGQEREDP
ncbi:MAG: ATP-binding protein [Deltaproteobacteria bacterium]|nr:ATP-binding protein [Deltaproteobacteria bacterium]